MTISNNLPNSKSHHTPQSSQPKNHLKLLTRSLWDSPCSSELEKSLRVCMSDPAKLNKLTYSPINFKINKSNLNLSSSHLIKTLKFRVFNLRLLVLVKGSPKDFSLKSLLSRRNSSNMSRPHNCNPSSEKCKRYLKVEVRSYSRPKWWASKTGWKTVNEFL